MNRRFWVLEHANSRSFIGRFDSHWTRTQDLDVAAMFTSVGEAEQARQALLQEAADRCSRAQDNWPAQMWWDIHGGAVVIRAVEQTMRVLALDEEEA